MPNEETVDLDDLHNEEEPIITEEDNLVIDEDDDLIADNDIESDTNNESEEIDKPELLSGTEKFLAQYGIIGGMIQFEGGESKHYDDLSQEEQFNVLTSIADGSKTPVEQEYDLVEDEIGLLNYIREQNKPVGEVLQDMVDAQIQKIDALRNISNEDLINMPLDSVYMKWLKEADPEATLEDLQESLEAAKKTKSFEKTTENLRKGFIQTQERLVQVEESRLEQEQARELEADRETIVNQVQDIKHVAGWDVSDDQKNEVLGSLLEVNSQGDSLFMERVFSDPAKLFRVAWLDTFGEAHFDEMANYYKNQISEAYARGRNEGIKGLPSKPITNSNTSSSKSVPATSKREDNNAIDLDSLHADVD